jgi:hypothetical protein
VSVEGFRHLQFDGEVAIVRLRQNREVRTGHYRFQIDRSAVLSPLSLLHEVGDTHATRLIVRLLLVSQFLAVLGGSRPLGETKSSALSLLMKSKVA